MLLASVENAGRDMWRIESCAAAAGDRLASSLNMCHTDTKAAMQAHSAISAVSVFPGTKQRGAVKAVYC